MGKTIKNWGILWKTLFIGFILTVVTLQAYVIHKLDVSVAPLEAKTKQQLISHPANQSHHETPQVVLLSYGDGSDVYLQNQNALSMSAINHGIDHVLSYRRTHIDDAFYEKNKSILIQPPWRGILALETLYDP